MPLFFRQIIILTGTQLKTFFFEIYPIIKNTIATLIIMKEKKISQKHHPFKLSLSDNVRQIYRLMVEYTSKPLIELLVISYSTVFKASTILMLRIFLSITKFTNKANTIVINAANAKLKECIFLPNITTSTSAV